MAVTKYYFGYWDGAANDEWMHKAREAIAPLQQHIESGKPTICVLGQDNEPIGGCFEITYSGGRTNATEFMAGAAKCAVLNFLRVHGLWRGGGDGMPNPEPAVQAITGDSQIAEKLAQANAKRLRKLN